MSDVLKSVAGWGAMVAAVCLNWFGWLGWDQEYDEHPDGSVSGPYESWQVVGLVGVLALLVLGAAAARRYWTAVLAPTFGMALAATVDWSDDETGLWVVGAFMIVFGTLVATGTAVALVHAFRTPGSDETPP